MTSNAPAVKATPRKTGRPRVTSEDKILDAARAIAAADPSTPVSIVSIARKLGIAPMAIYNYFPSRDALMQELSALLLTKLSIDIPDGADAFETISLWAHAIRVHFLKHPELLQILGWVDGYTSAAWLQKSEVIFRALGRLGLEGEELTKTIRWVWNVVMSAISVEIHERTTPSTLSASAHVRLSADVRPVVELMHRSAATEGFNERFFEFHVSMMIRGLRR